MQKIVNKYRCAPTNRNKLFFFGLIRKCPKILIQSPFSYTVLQKADFQNCLCLCIQIAEKRINIRLRAGPRGGHGGGKEAQEKATGEIREAHGSAKDAQGARSRVSQGGSRGWLATA